MDNSELISVKVQSAEEFKLLNKIWQFKGEKVVFTNGCFDIIHLGHIDYLAKAADLGSKLIVGINSDDSVTRLKGKTRPINNLQARSTVLAALRFVDAVVSFDEDTPYELIKAIVPDILVKGSDYKTEEIVGYDIVQSAGGEIITIDLVSGYSTSALEQKIVDLNK